jgi:glutathione S-transferase
MTLQLFGHPFSSYTQKALIALYETGAKFTQRVLGPDDPGTFAEFAKLSPIKKFPILVDGERVLLESSVIIEHVALHHPGRAALIPQDADRAIDVRMLDRIFDNYVMTPMQKIVGDRLRPDGLRDVHGVEAAKSALTNAYSWLNDTLAQRTWAQGKDFTMADCAAAPALFYADWVHEIGASFSRLRDYRQRLLARPSVVRAVDEARPYRPLFPGGAPNRD